MPSVMAGNIDFNCTLSTRAVRVEGGTWRHPHAGWVEGYENHIGL